MSNRYSSSSEQSDTPKRSKFSEIVEEENESDDEEQHIHSQRLSSSDISDEDGDLEAEILRKRQQFREELKEIKKIAVSSSEKKTKFKQRSNSKPISELSSQLYESAKSNTLDLSDTQGNMEIFSLGVNQIKQAQPTNDIEKRIKKLEEELSSHFKTSASKQSVQSSEAKPQKNDEEERKYVNFDQEAKDLNRQIESIKEQLESELRKEKENRQKIKRQIEISSKKHKKRREEPEKPRKKPKSRERTREEGGKQPSIQNDLSNYSELGVLQPNNKGSMPDIPGSISTVEHQKSQIIKIENQQSTSTMSKKDKLDYEIEILKRLENIRKRLKHSISRKLTEQTITEKNNQSKTMAINKSLNSYSNILKDKALNNQKHCPNCTYLLNKGVPTSYCSHQ